MKTLIVYVSEHRKNTEKIAKAFAEVIDADLINPISCELNSFDNYDLIGFGSGIYHSKFHASLYRLLDHCNPVQGKMAFIFSTSGHPEHKHLNNYNKEFESRLSSLGFSVVGNFSCRGHDAWGPLKLVGGINKSKPDSTDIENAKQFAESMKTKFLQD